MILRRLVPGICLICPTLLCLIPRQARADRVSSMLEATGQSGAALVAAEMAWSDWPGPSSAVIPPSGDLFGGELPDASSGCSAEWFSRDMSNPVGRSAVMITEPDSAESAGVMGCILAALGLGALLKLAGSLACREFLADVYYPSKY